MNTNQRILIKDPYLNTTYKSDIPHHKPQISAPKSNFNQQFVDRSKWKMEHDMRKQLERATHDFKRMARAYTDESMLNKKILDYQTVNNQYHEALKLRNLDLNNKLTNVSTQKHLMANRFEEDAMRNYHQKDLLLRKFQTQAQQLLQAKRTINNLLEIKTKMEEEVQFLKFQLQKEADRFNLQMRQQIFRMQGLQRSIKNITQTKDQQINQLRNRMRIYEDENKRLNDQNRSLHVANSSQRDKQNKGGIQNLSQIHHLDSQTKEYPDRKTFSKQLNQQKHINDRLQRQIEDLKKKLFSNNGEKDEKKSKQHEDNQNKKSRDSSKDINNVNSHEVIRAGQYEIGNPDGLINSINSLRNGINKEVFDIFYKSVKDGEKHRSNSLVIFIQNWKQLDLGRIHPYILSYFESRDALKQICLSDKYKGKSINDRIQQCIPLRVALRKGRNEVNIWILSTIQFTKNQREGSKKSMNNLLLFLFRLLTIQYRISYPMQGKSYTIDTDVRNELNHEIVKAINYIIDFQ